MCADLVSRKFPSDCGLYVLLDYALLSGRILEVAEQVLQGGADIIQFRAKSPSKRQYYEETLLLLDLARRYHAPFVVNDHLDIALAISADGIHLGQNDLPCRAARLLVPNHTFLGISTHSVEQAVKAAEEGADYIAIGPVFPTSTKENPDPVVGTRGVSEVRKRIGSLPLIAIGGINSGNVAEVIRAGADGVAVASAVALADHPESATRALTEEITRARHLSA
ncbi:MAG: thiamine phosphate synthase [Candidatus Abyssobacteria bacterium SURF_17]|uniref:Thiamine-phosphate synthase n=1 Tax=Candidatus Abyssobacteria bacterium SURF_17 TaxID=2093361 RepID=A0A419F013_9BACT|nr:MAG: thiamine phosphate synthase [Candidatus Abyssubacteria bacterium SURF_17]